MSEWVELTAGDGQSLSAFVVRPDGPAKGAVVVVQEIFGVNGHMQAVAAGYASKGYVAIAPALFDRQERGVALKYGGEDQQKAFRLMQGLSPETALLDIEAAYRFAKSEGHEGVAVVGFCYGGFMAWISATRGAGVGMQRSAVSGTMREGSARLRRRSLRAR